MFKYPAFIDMVAAKKNRVRIELEKNIKFPAYDNDFKTYVPEAEALPKLSEGMLRFFKQQSWSRKDSITYSTFRVKVS